jgi:hypothetical protein
VNFFHGNAARHDNFPTQRIIRPCKHSYRLGSGNQTANLSVVANPNWFFIGDPKVNSGNTALIASLQLSQPLVGHVEVSSNGHRVNTAGAGVGGSAQPSDSASANLPDARLGC